MAQGELDLQAYSFITPFLNNRRLEKVLEGRLIHKDILMIPHILAQSVFRLPRHLLLLHILRGQGLSSITFPGIQMEGVQ